jgi:hypothetical protein
VAAAIILRASSRVIPSAFPIDSPLYNDPL